MRLYRNPPCKWYIRCVYSKTNAVYPCIIDQNTLARNSDSVACMSVLIQSRGTGHAEFMDVYRNNYNNDILKYYCYHYTKTLCPSDTVVDSFTLVHTVIMWHYLDSVKNMCMNGISIYYLIERAYQFGFADSIEVALEYTPVERIPRGIVQRVITKGYTGCVNVLIQRVSVTDLLLMLGYAIGSTRLDYVISILDTGRVTVNDNPAHFISAIRKKKYAIVKEFQRRGAVYTPNVTNNQHPNAYSYTRHILAILNKVNNNQ